MNAQAQKNVCPVAAAVAQIIENVTKAENKKRNRISRKVKKGRLQFKSSWVINKDFTKPSVMANVGRDREEVRVERKKNEKQRVRLHSAVNGIYNLSSLKSFNQANEFTTASDEENESEDVFDRYGEKGVLARDVFGDFGFKITKDPDFGYKEEDLQDDTYSRKTGKKKHFN